MTGPTPNLALERPVSSAGYTVDVHNSNMTKIDAMMARVVICTSTTRPTTTYPGLMAFESDTGLLIVRNAANTGWLLFTEVFTCTSGTRPTATHPGMLIYEADTNFLVMRNAANTAWVIPGSTIWFETVNASSVTTNTGYTDSIGNLPGVAITVPPSGMLLVHFSAKIWNTGATGNQTTYLAPVVRQGNVIGGGAVLVSAIDDNSISGGSDNGATRPIIRYGMTMMIVGQTPGNFINIKLAQKSSTVSFDSNASFKKLIVQPV